MYLIGSKKNTYRGDTMTKDSILGFIRHILTFGGGFFVGEGFATTDELTTAVSAIVTLVGVVWSVIDKKGR